MFHCLWTSFVSFEGERRRIFHWWLSSSTCARAWLAPMNVVSDSFFFVVVAVFSFSQDLATKPLNCGTHSVNANTPSQTKGTLNGSPAYVSHPPLPTHSLSVAVGTILSKFGTCPTANCATTWKVTRVTWTQLPSLLTALSVPRVVKTPLPCFGILTKVNVCTPSKPTVSFTLLSFHPTVTGCVPLPTRALKFGIWNPKLLSMNFAQILM